MVNKRFMSLDLQVGQLHKKVVFLTIPGLATNILLGTAFTKRYIEKILLKIGRIGFVNLSPIESAEAAEKHPVMTDEEGKHLEPVETPIAIARLVRLSPVRETFVCIDTPAGGINLADAHDNWSGRNQEMMT